MRTIRINGNQDPDMIDICPFIKLGAHDTKDDDIKRPGNPEYVDILKIYCKGCDKIHELESWIN